MTRQQPDSGGEWSTSMETDVADKKADSRVLNGAVTGPASAINVRKASTLVRGRVLDDQINIEVLARLWKGIIVSKSSYRIRGLIESSLVPSSSPLSLFQRVGEERACDAQSHDASSLAQQRKRPGFVTMSTHQVAWPPVCILEQRRFSSDSSQSRTRCSPGLGHSASCCSRR